MTATITTAIPTDPTTRTLHLVDLENLVGDPYADGATAAAVFEQYLRLAHWQEGDLVHVAVNPHLALEVGWRLPAGCTLRTASGPDAADHRLQEQAEPKFVARRFGRLVIGSGDHGFIAHAWRRARQGWACSWLPDPARWPLAGGPGDSRSRTSSPVVSRRSLAA